MFKFELHAIVTDKVTGFAGVILARAEYATGCRQYAVQQQKLTKDGNVPDWLWWDETRLMDTGKRIKSLTGIGGPSSSPPTIQ